MNWIQLITSEMEETYAVADKLMGRPVDTNSLWRI